MSELAGVQSCDDGSVATYSAKSFFDYIKGNGESLSYSLATYEDGSTLWGKWQNTITSDPDGKTSSWEGTTESIGGTGRFEGIQGSGSYTGKRLASAPGVGAQWYLDTILTYTLPSE
ncbi:MAG TPA: hypothetical protein VEF33_09460 [Syntrophales bacterium]|nr:hypothetical protein [Syntrophales bacterium]